MAILEGFSNPFPRGEGDPPERSEEKRVGRGIRAVT